MKDKSISYLILLVLGLYGLWAVSCGHRSAPVAPQEDLSVSAAASGDPGPPIGSGRFTALRFFDAHGERAFGVLSADSAQTSAEGDIDNDLAAAHYSIQWGIVEFGPAGFTYVLPPSGSYGGTAVVYPGKPYELRFKLKCADRVCIPYQDSTGAFHCREGHIFPNQGDPVSFAGQRWSVPDTVYNWSSPDWRGFHLVLNENVGGRISAVALYHNGKRAFVGGSVEWPQ